MKLRIFQSDKGDCLLLEAQTGELFFCDGGMRASMKASVRAELGALQAAGREIDLACISHIDEDHIDGFLQLLEDEVEWRVFEHHEHGPNPVAPPTVPRPPVIHGILHNGFSDQVSVNKKAIESLLAAAAPALFATAVPELVRAAEEMQAISNSVPQAISVSKLIAADALDIPLNRPPGVQGPGKLLMAGKPGEAFDLGSMTFTLIGPTKSELLKLRKGWQHWLGNKPRLQALREKLRKQIDEFTAGALAGSPFDLGDWEGVPNIEGVTIPNVASLMFMVEEGGKRLLLTGDGKHEFIVAGLERAGFLDGGHVHLDVLKVQHHGSEKNMDVDFARQVSADHYVFCGNGLHHNPSIEVLDIVFESRTGPAAVRALAPQAANRPFHFWFSTTAAAQPDDSARKEHMEEVEQHVAAFAAQSNGLLTLHFNQNASIELAI
jgi:hypothetical protein